jgi:hypothetical protein
MTTPKQIDNNTISFCGGLYAKATGEKPVSSKDPEFWEWMKKIDNGDALIFERNFYLRNND